MIALPAHANSGEYALAKAMQAGGLTLADADLVLMDFPAMLAALASKAIDVAGAMPEPLATIAVQNGSGVKWGKAADLVPGSGTVVVFSSGFAAQHDVATRWITAYLRGVRDFNDAFIKNMHRQQTAETLASSLAIAPGLFNGMSLPYMDPNGKVDVASVQAQMDWYVQMGYLSAPIDLSKVIDASFATAAVAQLGPYE
jgi:NitT/TauT family transport system substrate-binding protein